MTHREYDDFAALEPEVRERVDRMVWCSVATIDTRNRPSSRLLHTIWEGQTCWVGTHRNSTKRLHLEKNPHVSLAYVSDVVHPVYVEATATWEDDPAIKAHVWELFRDNAGAVGL